MPMQPNQRTTFIQPSFSPRMPHSTFEKMVVKKKTAHTCSHSEVVKPSSSTNIIGIITAKPNSDRVLIILTMLDSRILWLV